MNLHVTSYIGQTSHSLKQRYQEHTRRIKHNEPQLAYVLHILNNKHKYGPINNTLTLLKHIDKTILLLPYEQLTIHPIITTIINSSFQNNTQVNITPCIS